MNKILIKRNRKIEGFVWQSNAGQWYYAFGKPSQASYMSFECVSAQQGIERIEETLNDLKTALK